MPNAFFIDRSSNRMKLSVSDYFMVGDTKLYASLFLVFVAFLLAYKGMMSLTYCLCRKPSPPTCVLFHTCAFSLRVQTGSPASPPDTLPSGLSS